MRHRNGNKRLGRQSAHRKAVLKNQVKSLLTKERISTTLSLAKESRRLAEKLITLGKNDTVAARRQAFEVLADRDLVKLLFSELAPRFASRAGGYTRIVHLGNRRGDNAELAILELTEMKKVEEKTVKEKKPKKAKKETVAKIEKKETKTTAKSKKTEEKAKENKKTEEEDKKGFMGGLRKFLKQDKAE
ncbi:MAG: 50S ribosomal protein L17 [Candidatus Omnitrophica bacterium]|nr:50S ribosomal protein L17 [Candidatus Omnitrophota bacterium]